MIDKLEMFLALARERHFGRAAEACGVSQPTLSAAIRSLEDQLGVQLVWRGSRFRGLTPEGARALDWARRITADARALRDEMRAARGGLAGRLVLGVVPTALSAIAGLTAPFLARHPGVRLQVVSANSAEILAGLDEHAMDAGVTYLGNEPLGRVEAVPLYPERYRLLALAEGPFAGRTAVAWAELAGQPLCLLGADMQNRRIVNQHLAAAGVTPEPRVESNSVLALIAHVRAGGWMSVIPETLAELLDPGPGLCALPLVDPAVAYWIGLVVPPRAPRTPLIEALVEAARRRGREAGAPDPS